MKKIVIMMSLILLNIALFSCTPQSISEEINPTQACCGEEGDFPPPPPPPPPGGIN